VLSSRKTLLANAGRLLSANLYSQIAAICCGILIGRWIKPADYGIWVALSILPSYLSFLQLGTANGLGRDLPVNLGKGDVAEARALIGTSFRFNLIAATSAAAGLLIFGLCVSPANSAMWHWGLGVMAFSAFSSMMGSFLFIVGRSYSQFHRLSLVMAGQTTLSLLGMFWVYRRGLEGLYWRSLVCQIFSLGGNYVMVRKYLSWNFQLGHLKLLIRVGLPIFLAGYAAQLFSVADRSLVSLLLGREQVGLYGFASFVYGGMGMLGRSLSEVLYPDLAFRFGRDGDVRRMWHSTKLTILWLSTLMGAILIAAWLLLPVAMERLVPAYQQAVTPARILLLAGAVECIGSLLGGIFMNIMGWAWAYSIVWILRAGLLWSAGWWALQKFGSLESVAFVNVLSAVFFSLGIMCLCRRIVRKHDTINAMRITVPVAVTASHQE
jgi:O-antigen/teichoic acid export membrane protein